MPGGVVDSLKGAVFWAPTTALLYTRWALATSISALPVLAHALYTRKNLLNDLGGLFRVLNALPLGRYCFSGLVAAFAPNNASYAAVVTELGEGKCECFQYDFPWYRNPFQSTHAVAIVSLGELASGLAVVASLQRIPGVRGIPVRIEARYLQKLRGTAYASVDASPVLEVVRSGGFRGGEHAFLTPIRNGAGQLCAEVTVTWSFQTKPAASASAALVTGTASRSYKSE